MNEIEGENFGFKFEFNLADRSKIPENNFSLRKNSRKPIHVRDSASHAPSITLKELKTLKSSFCYQNISDFSEMLVVTTSIKPPRVQRSLP